MATEPRPRPGLSSSPRSPRYGGRIEGLDGIRALAIVAVLVFHLNASWLPGGFLGVDVFFVVSGFLITTLLVREHQRSGRIDFRGFWVRRARRLLPALVVTVTVSADNPEPVLTVRQLPPPGDGVIAVELYVCPDGLPAPWAEPWFCAVDVTGWDLSLTSDAFSGSLTTADAPASDAGYTFSGLPVGYEYRLSLQEMPDGYPLIQVKPGSPGEGPVRVDLQPDYSVQTVRFYAVTTAEADLSGPDTDGDGLPDHLESGVLSTDPAIVDSDGDGVTDRDEVQNGTNPLDPASYSVG